MTAPEPAPDPAPALAREAERVDQLLADVEALAPGPVWQRVEELVQRLVRLYGAALARVMDHVGERGGLDGELAARLAGDELVSSFLLLHGLHPWPVAERVRLALERAQPQLQAQIGVLVLAGVEGEVARLRVEGELVPGAAALPVERVVLRCLADAAPELTRVEVAGLPPPPPPREAPLVQIAPHRPRHPGEVSR